jgi:hypothetical protein
LPSPIFTFLASRSFLESTNHYFILTLLALARDRSLRVALLTCLRLVVVAPCPFTALACDLTLHIIFLCCLRFVIVAVAPP